MTLTQKCRELGIHKAKVLIKYSGRTRQGLTSMMRNEPRLFELICLGLVVKLESEDISKNKMVSESVTYEK